MRNVEILARMSFALGLTFIVGAGRTEATMSLDDIHFWIGNGANRAALVIDWNGDSLSDRSLAWGFRWDGAASGATMLTAILAADPRLFAKLGENGSLGAAVLGLGYDLNDDGQFELDDGTQFDVHGVAISELTDGAASLDPADSYDEGWFLGVWTYGTANTSPWIGGGWSLSGAGASGRMLVNGAWDSWAFTPTFYQGSFAGNAFPSVQPSDFDSNSHVDGIDFLTWQRSVGVAVDAMRGIGDANGDGDVDAGDLAAWTAAFGNAPPVGAVPEPSGGQLVLPLFALWGIRTHLRRNV